MNFTNLSSSVLIFSSIIGIYPGTSSKHLGDFYQSKGNLGEQTEHSIDSSQIISLLHPFTFVKYTASKNAYTHTVDPSKWSQIAEVKSVIGGGVAIPDIKILAVGGGLTAGVQNAGLFRVGQLSAYPNLVAKQMGIRNFVTPTFEQSEENGTGFLALKDDDSEFPNFEFIQTEVAGANQLQDEPPMLKPFGQPSDNFAAPGLSVDGFASQWEPRMKGAVVNLTTGKSWPKFMPFVWRLSNPAFFETSNIIDLINSKDFNFFLLEDLHERFLHVLKTRDQLGLSDLIGDLQTGNDSGLKSIKLLLGKGRRGAIFTIPDFRDLAAYNWYTPQYLKENCSDLEISVLHPSGSVDQVDVQKPFWLLPTSKVDSCYRNLNPGSPLKIVFKDIDILTVDELIQYDFARKKYNDRIRSWAKEYNLALVDIEDLYKTIHQSEFPIQDGLAINGGTRGNFFSFDGIYPSTLGQAIIANHVLHSINETYKTNYLPINITEYAKTVNSKL